MTDPDPSRPLNGAALVRPLTRLLRPLVRLLIRSGVTFPQFAELVRGVYVDVAGKDVLGEQARSDSRVSLLTGVHRKEIRRLRESGIDAGSVPPAVTLNSQIINQWLTAARFTDAEGRPLALKRLAQKGDAASFEALVRSVTTDVRPRAVLDEWLRQDIVRVQPDDRIALRETAFIPPAGQDSLLYYFARNLHDHIAAAAANIGEVAQGEPRFLDLSVHYDRLSPESVALLQQEGRIAAQQLLVEINRRAHALAEAEDVAGIDPGAPTQRINLGVYLYMENETTAETGQ